MFHLETLKTGVLLINIWKWHCSISWVIEICGNIQCSVHLWNAIWWFGKGIQGNERRGHYSDNDSEYLSESDMCSLIAEHVLAESLASAKSPIVNPYVCSLCESLSRYQPRTNLGQDTFNRGPRHKDSEREFHLRFVPLFDSTDGSLKHSFFPLMDWLALVIGSESVDWFFWLVVGRPSNLPTNDEAALFRRPIQKQA